MPTSTGNRPYTAKTQEALDRLGFTDPYDPRFIYRSVFGSKMRGRAQTWPSIDLDALHEVNRDVVGWIHMDGTPLDYPVVKTASTVRITCRTISVARNRFMARSRSISATAAASADGQWYCTATR